MDNVVTVKQGVLFTIIAPGGFRILEAISQTARELQIDLCVTSACDGEHSGPTDPHKRGEAYDVRSKTLTIMQKNAVLLSLSEKLPADKFYFFLEAAGTANEHFHCQVKKGATYP
jgi:hypothetical protein